jgi:hypothetical protein
VALDDLDQLRPNRSADMNPDLPREVALPCGKQVLLEGQDRASPDADHHVDIGVGSPVCGTLPSWRDYSSTISRVISARAVPGSQP